MTQSDAIVIDQPRSSLLHRLRDATQEVHERLHVHSLTKPLTLSSLTQEHYIHVLKAFYGFYTPLALHIESAAMRSTWLEKDLQYFDANTEECTQCFDLPPSKKKAQQLGCLYVTEGSSLGSQVIFKHLKRSLGVSPEAGGRFFYAYGKETGEKWRNTKAILTSQPESLHGDIIAAAQQTFSCLERWLTYIHKRPAW